MHREKRVFQAGTQRRSVPNFQKAVELAHSGKLGKLHTLHASVYVPVARQHLAARPADPGARRGGLEPVARPGARGVPSTRAYVDGQWRGQWDFDSGARLLDWGAHTVDLCQWANKADDTMPIEYEPSEKNIVCRYANGVKLVLDFLKAPFKDRSPQYITRLGTCPVRFVGDEGSVETGRRGRNRRHARLAPEGSPEGPSGSAAWTCPLTRATSSTASARASKTAANPDVMRRSHIACHAAAIAWVLGRQTETGPRKRSVHRRRGSQPPVFPPRASMGELRITG